MTGVELIAAERERQVAVEGWTPEHDNRHEFGELSAAAITYAGLVSDVLSGCNFDRAAMANCSRSWPWEAEWWKPSPDPIRNLVKAGALIAAEIDRLQRAERPKRGTEPHA